MRDLRSNSTLARPSQRLAAALVVLITALVLSPSAVFGSPGRPQAAPPAEPSAQDVYVVMRDMDLAYEDVTIRTIVPHDEGASALVGLTDGTLVDVVLRQAALGWSLRNIYYVAGNADSFRTWAGPWRTRVAEARRFLAAANNEDAPQRRPEELAPLIWFEDLQEGDRLWGLNPTTYRIMQTLKMMPNLTGPMGGGR